jgi:hypothetical protein
MRRPLFGVVELDLRDVRGAAVALLGAAAVLPLMPDHGGLPCPLRTLTGVPCPLCGMTTSVDATVHGHPLAALAANPAGPFAIAAAVALLVRRKGQWLRVPAVVLLGVALGMWLFELGRFSLI